MIAPLVCESLIDGYSGHVKIFSFLQSRATVRIADDRKQIASLIVDRTET